MKTLLNRNKIVFLLFFSICLNFFLYADDVPDYFKVPIFNDFPKEIGLPAQLPDGTTVGMIDFNTDGWVDLKIGSQLWKNSNGKFSKWHKLPLTHHCFGDIDNDGNLDVFCSSFKEYGDDVDFKWKLLKNDGKKLVDISKTAGFTNLQPTKAIAFLDYDRDGNLDFFAAGYETVFGKPSYAMLADNLYKGNGKGNFTEVTEVAGMKNQKSRGDKFNGRPACGVSLTDINNDGYIDIFVANYRLEPNFLWLNLKDGTFKNIAKLAGVDGGFSHSNGVSWADIDKDGDLDLFVANLAHAWVPESQKSKLYRNDFLPMKKMVFTDATEKFGLEWKPSKDCEPEADWINPIFADFNNDGLIDLFVTESAQGGTNHPKYDKKYKKKFDSGYSKFYMQFDDKEFARFDTDKNRLKLEDTWGSSAADVDNDGNVDLLVGSGTWNADPKTITWFDPKNQKIQLLKNNGIEFDEDNMADDHKFINITLFARDRALTGSIVRIIKADSEELFTVLDLGYSGYSNKSNQLHFGLGSEGVEEIIVKTPDGDKVEFECPEDEPWVNISLLVDCSKKKRAEPMEIRKLSPELSIIYSRIQQAESALNDSEFIEAYYFNCYAEILIEEAPRKLSKEDKLAMSEFMEKIQDLDEQITDELEREEVKALKQLIKAIEYEVDQKYDKAVKKYKSILKSYEDTETAAFAEKKIVEILTNTEYGREISDKLAGAKVRSMLKSAEKLLKKDEFEKAKKILKEIIQKHPYSSYAEKAKAFLDKMKAK